MVVARACPIMCINHKHCGQCGYRGHVINLPQAFLDKLLNIKDLQVLVVHRHGADNTHIEFRVRRDRVFSALQWFKAEQPLL